MPNRGPNPGRLKLHLFQLVDALVELRLDFVDAAGIIQRMRGKLDRRYLIRWATKIGVNAELADILRR